MHARIVAYTGASNLDDGVVFIREKAAPIARQQKGYAGLSVSVDRAAKTLNVMSSWANEADLKASDAAIAGLRTEGGQILGAGEPTIANLEVLVSEVGDQPPAEGCRLRVIPFEADLARIDEEAKRVQSEVVPAMKKLPGFRGFRLMVDRSTGRGTIGAVFTDEATLQASEDFGKERRQEASTRGVLKFGDVSRREIAYLDAP